MYVRGRVRIGIPGMSNERVRYTTCTVPAREDTIAMATTAYAYAIRLIQQDPYRTRTVWIPAVSVADALAQAHSLYSTDPAIVRMAYAGVQIAQPAAQR